MTGARRALALVLVLGLMLPVPPASAQVLTHYIQNPVVEVEVDTDASGKVTAMRYRFEESDPSASIAPTLAVKQSSQAPASSQASMQVQVESATESATASASTAVCELPTALKNLTQQDLDRLARTTNLPLSPTAATRAAQTTLTIGGAATAKIGSQLVSVASQAFNTTATWGSTVVLKSRMLGPLQVTVGLAGTSAVALIGGTVGVGLLAAAAVMFGVAIAIENKKTVTQVSTTIPVDAPPVRSPNQLVVGSTYGDFSFLYSQRQQEVLEYDHMLIQLYYPELIQPPTATCGAYLCYQALDYLTGVQVGWGPNCTWSYLNAGKTCCATIWGGPESSNAPYYAYPPDDPDCPCWMQQGVVETPAPPVIYVEVP